MKSDTCSDKPWRTECIQLFNNILHQVKSYNHVHHGLSDRPKNRWKLVSGTVICWHISDYLPFPQSNWTPDIHSHQYYHLHSYKDSPQHPPPTLWEGSKEAIVKKNRHRSRKSLQKIWTRYCLSVPTITIQWFWQLKSRRLTHKNN